MPSLNSLCQSDCNQPHMQSSPDSHCPCLFAMIIIVLISIEFRLFFLLYYEMAAGPVPLLGPHTTPCMAVYTNVHPWPLLSQGASIRNSDDPALESTCPAMQHMPAGCGSWEDREGQTRRKGVCCTGRLPFPWIFCTNMVHYCAMLFFLLRKDLSHAFQNAGGDDGCGCGRTVLGQRSNPRETQSCRHPQSPLAHSLMWWQLRSPCSPGHSSHLTQHSQSSSNCSWATEGWTNHGPAPSPQAWQGAVEVLKFQSWPWEKGGKERCQAICHLWAVFYIGKVASTLLIFGDSLKERACEELKELMVQK